MESILRTEPKTEVILALTSGSRERTSLAYTDNSHLGLGMGGRGGGAEKSGGSTMEESVKGSQTVRYSSVRCDHAEVCSSCSFLKSCVTLFPRVLSRIIMTTR